MQTCKCQIAGEQIHRWKKVRLISKCKDLGRQLFRLLCQELSGQLVDDLQPLFAEHPRKQTAVLAPFHAGFIMITTILQKICTTEDEKKTAEVRGPGQG